MVNLNFVLFKLLYFGCSCCCCLDDLQGFERQEGYERPLLENNIKNNIKEYF